MVVSGAGASGRRLREEEERPKLAAADCGDRRRRVEGNAGEGIAAGAAAGAIFALLLAGSGDGCIVLLSAISIRAKRQTSTELFCSGKNK